MMGERKPALRFKGFEAEWKTFRLGDNSDIITGGTPNTKVIEFWHPKEIPWLSSGEVNKKRINFTENMISHSGLSNSSANWVKKNSVLIALAGQGKTRGTVAITNIPLTTNQSVAAIIPNDVLNPEFIFQNLESRYDELRTNSSGDRTRGGLNKHIIFETSVSAPKIEEQTIIGDYFKHLDALITQKQRKYDSLLNVKKSMLEKMFPKDGADVPEIRFKGFSGAWDASELGELAVEVIRKSPENSTVPVMMISARSGFINQSEKYSSDNAGSSLKNYTLLQKGELSYNHGYSKFRNYGSCFELKEEEARIPFVYHSFALPNDNSTFYSQYLNSGVFDGELKKRVSSTARMDGLLNISYSAYMSINVCRPCFEEQTKIGNYFKQLDTLISLHQKKHDHLKHIKSALLEKMFVTEAA